jgi:hypothetical protein
VPDQSQAHQREEKGGVILIVIASEAPEQLGYLALQIGRCREELDRPPSRTMTEPNRVAPLI